MSWPRQGAIFDQLDSEKCAASLKSLNHSCDLKVKQLTAGFVGLYLALELWLFIPRLQQFIGFSSYMWTTQLNICILWIPWAGQHWPYYRGYEDEYNSQLLGGASRISRREENLGELI